MDIVDDIRIRAQHKLSQLEKTAGVVDLLRGVKNYAGAKYIQGENALGNLLSPYGLNAENAFDHLGRAIKRKYAPVWRKNVEMFDGKQWNPKQWINSYDIYRGIKDEGPMRETLKRLYYGVPAATTLGVGAGLGSSMLGRD